VSRREKRSGRQDTPEVVAETDAAARRKKRSSGAGVGAVRLLLSEPEADSEDFPMRLSLAVRL